MFTATTLIFVAVYVVLFVMRRQLGAFLSIAGAMVTMLIHLNIGIDPPIPGSVVAIYTAFIIAASLLYILASEQTAREFWAPIRETIVNPRRRPLLGALLILIPLAVAWRTWQTVKPDVQAPAKFRTVHPSPPGKVAAHGESIDTKRGVNPLRGLETTSPEQFKEHVLNGRAVYYQNCYFCHGDELQADGHYALALQPRPISFRDSTTIAMFTETFLFWRVAKGGPGLPGASTPWDSAMPAWEDFLTNQQMWEVILYLYDRTDQRPREVMTEGDTH